MERTGRPVPRWLAAVLAFALVGGLALLLWSARSGSTRPAPQAPVTPMAGGIAPSDPGTTARGAREYRCRIRNDTGLGLDHVRLVPRTGAGVTFGSLAADAVTGYRTVGYAEDLATIVATSDGQRYEFRQARYIGEAEWQPSDYTYVLGLDRQGRPVFTFSGWG
jgi:hypothetical protein